MYNGAEFEAETCIRISWPSSGPCRHQFSSLAAFPVRAISTRPHCRTCQKGETGGFPVWETTRSLLLKLPTNTEPLDDALVTWFITHLDIVKQLAALADQLEQTTA